jgi:hypothetical protein
MRRFCAVLKLLVIAFALAGVLSCVWPRATSFAQEAAAQFLYKGQPLTEAQRNYWAFRKPVRPAVPAVKRAAWVKNPVDAFVLARLEAKGLTPSAPADKRTLLRRVT